MTEPEIFDRADFYSASDDVSELRFVQAREVIDDIHSHTLGPHGGCTVYAWNHVPVTDSWREGCVRGLAEQFVEEFDDDFASEDHCNRVTPALEAIFLAAVVQASALMYPWRVEMVAERDYSAEQIRGDWR